MKKCAVLALAASLSILAIHLVVGGVRTEEASSDSMLIHNVYFSLKDSSLEAKEKMVTACKKYLAKHPGTVFFSVGTLVGDLNRPVNDRDFDVGLHLVFKNRAAHDKYQKAPLHEQFIEENRDSWKKVRVFDTYAQ